MSEAFESVIDQDWDELAIDDGTITSSYNSYTAVLYPREDTNSEPFESQVDSIRYSPEVNAAVPMTLDVEPREVLEGEDFLSGIVDVFVDGEPLFSGEIIRIETNKKNDDFYSIKAKPPGQKLNEQSIDVTTEDFIVSDFIAKTIDKYNDFDDEHFNLEGTSSENLSNITSERRIRIADSDGATAEYSNVGDESDGVVIYSKISTPDETSEVTIQVDAFDGSDSVTFNDLTTGDKGTWVEFEPNNVSGDYGIHFTLDEDCILYDWTAVYEPLLRRTVDPLESEVSLENELIYEVEDFEEETEVDYGFLEEDETPIDISSSRTRLYQSSFTGEVVDEDGSNIIEDDIWSRGEAQLYNEPFGDFSFDFFNSYTIPESRAVIAFRGSNDSNVRGDLLFDNEVVFGDITVFSSDPGWSFFDFSSAGMGDVSPGSHTIEFDITDGSIDSGETGLVFDLVNFHDDEFIGDFDNEVDVNGYLENPPDYSDSFIIPDIIFPTVSAGQNILSATVDVDEINQNSVSSLGLSLDGGENYTTLADTNSLTVDSRSIGSTTKGRYKLGNASEFGRREQTPSLGYSSQAVGNLEITITAEDITVIFSRNFTGNRLETISNIADDYSNTFRWEGNKAQIFKNRTRKTDVDLKKEDVTSVSDIEDVYSSVEVIGLGGVTSGVIEAENAPDYINRHKEIRDADIETEDDAIQKARSFLEDNAEINYEGEIETLPTRGPVGEMIDGSLFSHGKDSVIRRVRYGKRNTTISCDRQKDLRKEILDLDRDIESSESRETR